MAGYYKFCNFCGHSFSGPTGARMFIQHLYDHSYYGQQVTGWKVECWVYHQTSLEREFLERIGSPYEYGFTHWTPPE